MDLRPNCPMGSLAVFVSILLGREQTYFIVGAVELALTPLGPGAAAGSNK